MTTFDTDDLDCEIGEEQEAPLAPLAPGDVVVLMSGGIVMTLGPETSPGTHVCYWFDEMGNLQTVLLPLVVLGHPV